MANDSPADVLGEVTRLRRLTRARVHGAAAPLTVFGLLTLASIPLYQSPFGIGVDMMEGYGGTISGYSGLEGVDRSAALSVAFWLIAGPLCYLGCAWLYRRRADRTGLSVRWQPFAYVGLALMGVVLAALFAQQYIVREPAPWGFTLENVISPLLAIALGLLVLAWVERSWGVAVIGLVYGGLSAVMNGYGLGEIPPWIAPPLGGSNDWFIWPGINLVLLASVLLVGALVLWIRAARVASASS